MGLSLVYKRCMCRGRGAVGHWWTAAGAAEACLDRSDAGCRKGVEAVGRYCVRRAGHRRCDVRVKVCGITLKTNINNLVLLNFKI